jgi:cytochrome c oxidase cbb3-type subunit 3
MPARTIKLLKWVAGALALLIFIGGSAILGWQRQARQLRLDPSLSADLERYRLMPNGISGTPPESYFALGKPYESDAYNLSQGKRLYTWYRCETCHGDGRGGIGPSFIDGWWLYGPEMVSIVASIHDGRPHGMPAFRDRMTIEQVWQLAGYVQTIGSYTAKSAAPGRNDDRQTRPAENRAPAKIFFDPGPVHVHLDQGPSP